MSSKKIDYSLDIHSYYKGETGVIDISASSWATGNVSDLTEYDGHPEILKHTSDNASTYKKAALSSLPSVNNETIISFWMNVELYGTTRAGLFFQTSTVNIVGIMLSDTGVVLYYRDSSMAAQVITISTSTTHIDAWEHFEIYTNATTHVIKAYIGGQLKYSSDFGDWTGYISFDFHIYQNDAYLDGLCINGVHLENYQIGGIYGSDFVEQSAVVKHANLDDMLSLNIDNRVDKSEFPLEIRKGEEGLGLGEQVRWLQRCIQEENQMFMIMYDGLVQQLKKNHKLIKELQNVD